MVCKKAGKLGFARFLLLEMKILLDSEPPILTLRPNS
jgi:hypothetical protein